MEGRVRAHCGGDGDARPGIPQLMQETGVLWLESRRRWGGGHAADDRGHVGVDAGRARLGIEWATSPGVDMGAGGSKARIRALNGRVRANFRLARAGADQERAPPPARHPPQSWPPDAHPGETLICGSASGPAWYKTSIGRVFRRSNSCAWSRQPAFGCACLRSCILGSLFRFRLLPGACPRGRRIAGDGPNLGGVGVASWWVSTKSGRVGATWGWLRPNSGWLRQDLHLGRTGVISA